jgi:hypothetical protein
MNDLAHIWSGDLAISNTGDLAVVSGPDCTSQRVYRRLLTNPQTYLWHLNYGAGLAQYVGMPASEKDIEAVILNQIQQESAIASIPAPQVVTRLADAANGYFVTDIRYQDALSNTAVQVSVPTGAN